MTNRKIPEKNFSWILSIPKSTIWILVTAGIVKGVDNEYQPKSFGSFAIQKNNTNKSQLDSMSKPVTIFILKVLYDDQPDFFPTYRDRSLIRLLPDTVEMTWMDH